MFGNQIQIFKRTRSPIRKSKETQVIETKVVQPYHFTVNTYAKGFYTIECSVHLSKDQIATMSDENSPIVQGIKKLRDTYEAMGYVHATGQNLV